MKTGTKSLLWGVHQFIWHPLTILLAWHKLYGWPNWKEFVCIVIHDWGYWFCEKMDDEKGEEHPYWAANLALRWFGSGYYWLCLCHSRHLAKNLEYLPSKLCWADKLSFLYDPWWFYLLRAWLSKELLEFRKNAHNSGHVAITESHKQWHKWLRGVMKTLATQQKGDACPYNKQGKI